MRFSDKAPQMGVGQQNKSLADRDAGTVQRSQNWRVEVAGNLGKSRDTLLHRKDGQMACQVVKKATIGDTGMRRRECFFALDGFWLYVGLLMKD